MTDPVEMPNLNENNGGVDGDGGNRVPPGDETTGRDSDTNANNSQPHPHHGDDDDEEECRVCRGPAEEGYVVLLLSCLFVLVQKVTNCTQLRSPCLLLLLFLDD